MYKKTVEMYADGYELVEIMEECLLGSEAEVIEDIKAFKELCKVVRGSKRFTFNTDFKEMLINRFTSNEDCSVYKLSKELDLSTSTISKYLKEAGIKLEKGNTKEKDYEVLENWDDFECCPTCNGQRNVRNIGLHNQEEANSKKPTHSFCSSCNTEWYEEDGETRKVLWFAIK